MEAVNKEYGEQIKAARTVVEEQLDKLEASLGTAQKSQFETVKKMIGPIFQAVEDGKSGLATLEVRPDAVTYHEELQLRSGTPTADLLKTAKIVGRSRTWASCRPARSFTAAWNSTRPCSSWPARS